jgi:hypothetical protein
MRVPVVACSTWFEIQSQTSEPKDGLCAIPIGDCVGDVVMPL